MAAPAINDLHYQNFVSQYKGTLTGSMHMKCDVMQSPSSACQKLISVKQH